MSETVILFIIGQTVAILGVVLTAYMKIITRQKELEIRVAHIERQDENVLNKLDRNYIEVQELKHFLSTEISYLKELFNNELSVIKIKLAEHKIELGNKKNKEL